MRVDSMNCDSPAFVCYFLVVQWLLCTNDILPKAAYLSLKLSTPFYHTLWWYDFLRNNLLWGYLIHLLLWIGYNCVLQVMFQQTLGQIYGEWGIGKYFWSRAVRVSPLGIGNQWAEWPMSLYKYDVLVCAKYILIMGLRLVWSLDSEYNDMW